MLLYAIHFSALISSTTNAGTRLPGKAFPNVPLKSCVGLLFPKLANLSPPVLLSARTMVLLLLRQWTDRNVRLRRTSFPVHEESLLIWCLKQPCETRAHAVHRAVFGHVFMSLIIHDVSEVHCGLHPNTDCKDAGLWMN